MFYQLLLYLTRRFLIFLYISFFIQTYLGTNGPTGADVPLSIKQTNKQTKNSQLSLSKY